MVGHGQRRESVHTFECTFECTDGYLRASATEEVVGVYVWIRLFDAEDIFAVRMTSSTSVKITPGLRPGMSFMKESIANLRLV